MEAAQPICIAFNNADVSKSEVLISSNAIGVTGGNEGIITIPRFAGDWGVYRIVFFDKGLSVNAIVWFWVNSNTILKSNGLRYYSAHVDSEEKTVRLTFDGHFAGILIVDQNKYTNIYAVGASSGIKQISIGNADSPQPSKSGNTISIPMRAWSSFILITNDNSVIKL